MDAYGAGREDVACTFAAVASAGADPVAFAQLVERTAAEADGLVLVAREDLTINRAVRTVTARGVPVVCVATDLPSSGRLAFVGSDQTAAGATAAHLMGRVLGERAGNVLLVISAPYRGQEERELGFRRVLRAEFPASPSRSGSTPTTTSSPRTATSAATSRSAGRRSASTTSRPAMSASPARSRRRGSAARPSSSATS